MNVNCHDKGEFIIGNGVVSDGSVFIEKGAVLVKNGRIVRSGPVDDMKIEGVPFYDVAGRLIVPGLANFHHHLYSHFAPGIVPHGPSEGFVDVLKDLWWPLDSVMDEESTYWSALCGVMDSVRHGVTTVFDHHVSMNYVTGSLESIARAFKEVGIRGGLCFEISDRLGADRVAEQFEENLSFWESSVDSQVLTGFLGLHANLTLSESTMAFLSKEKPVGMPVHVHCGEGREDFTFCVEKGYEGPVHRLEAFELLSEKSILAHCIHLSDVDYNIIKNRDLAVVTNPESNANNRVGKMDRSRIADYLLGTDGMTCDMVASLRSAYLMDRLAPDLWSGLNRSFWDGRFDFQRKFFPGASGFRPGSDADIAVLDYVPLSPINVNNLTGHLIFGAKGGSSYMTVSAGDILWLDGHFTRLNETVLLSEALKVAHSLHSRFYATRWNS